MRKQNRAITLIALIITIIVLLILAGVTINMVLGENGLFNKAKTSVAKYENVQEKENTALGGYETEIDNARETVTLDKKEYESILNRLDIIEKNINISMHSPILLVSANMDNTGDAERVAGTYIASNAIYNKSNSEEFEDYLDFTTNMGWTVKKSGWYLVRGFSRAEYSETAGQGSMYSSLLINGQETRISFSEYNKGVFYTAEDEPSATLWFNQGDVIDYKYVTSKNTRWSWAQMSIYALFE